MVNSGVCCASLVQPKSLMKIGLCMVLVGHVNFLLGALVHGTVLRHVSIGAQTPEYAISNILALAAGLAGVIVGILAIVLSKNEKSRPLSTTLILWVPLILMSVVEVLFSGRCLAVCINFIRRKPAPQYEGRSVKTLRAAEPLVLPYYIPPPRRYRGDGEERLPERPPEQHELLRASQRLYSSTRSAQNRPSPTRFDRAQLNRASFWI
ncbi:transmembrane protein 54b isoform X4 [Colossoma macropomum]|uniref:transmembrane protein 54b isoform X4 n=1 Tax=Colossoma macropomum TaxID=42526 RepID=UPI00186514EB|nr:transmembrane protein 54b isoform X4 [Colossoma macropomum]